MAAQAGSGWHHSCGGCPKGEYVWSGAPALLSGLQADFARSGLSKGVFEPAPPLKGESEASV